MERRLLLILTRNEVLLVPMLELHDAVALARKGRDTCLHRLDQCGETLALQVVVIVASALHLLERRAKAQVGAGRRNG